MTDGSSAPGRLENTTPPPKASRIRWWLAGLLTALGILLIWVGHAFAHGFSTQDATDESYLSGVAVNIGTTLLLAAALVLFERALIRTTEGLVKRETEPLRIQAARNAEETQRLTEATVAIETRLSSLDAQMATRVAQQMREQTEAAEAVNREVTRDTVLNLVRLAAQSRAIGQAGNDDGSGRITVLAGSNISAPPVSIEYYPEKNDGWNDDQPERILLAFGNDYQRPEIEWLEGVGVVDAFELLQDAMIKQRDAGLFVREVRLQDFFTNLRATLELAYERRRGHGDFWITGSPVFELVAPEWVITSLGVEVKDHGVVVRREQFGHFDDSDFGRRAYVDRNLPTRRADLDSEIWDRALERGATYFEEYPDFW